MAKIVLTDVTQELTKKLQNSRIFNIYMLCDNIEEWFNENMIDPELQLVCKVSHSVSNKNKKIKILMNNHIVVTISYDVNFQYPDSKINSIEVTSSTSEVHDKQSLIVCFNELCNSKLKAIDEKLYKITEMLENDFQIDLNDARNIVAIYDTLSMEDRARARKINMLR